MHDDQNAGENYAHSNRHTDPITGRDPNWNVYGTSGQDVIFCGTGDDHVWGRDGYDIIYTGNGENTVWTGSGGGEVIGGRDNDTVYAGQASRSSDSYEIRTHGGNDTLYCIGDEWDRINASMGSGDDVVYASSPTKEIVHLGRGDDVIFTSASSNSAQGGDRVIGGLGGDTFNISGESNWLFDAVFVIDFQDVGDRIEVGGTDDWIIEHGQDHDGLPSFNILNSGNENQHIAKVTAETFIGEIHASGRMDYTVTVAFDGDSLEVVDRQHAFGRGAFEFIHQQN